MTKEAIAARAINKGRKSELFANIAVEEEEIGNIELNLNEDPVTIGS